jgi:hypothetical protein
LPIFTAPGLIEPLYFSVVATEKSIFGPMLPATEEYRLDRARERC